MISGLSLYYHGEFNKAYESAIKRKCVRKSSTRLLEMLDRLNDARKEEGMSPLFLPKLESYRR